MIHVVWKSPKMSGSQEQNAIFFCDFQTPCETTKSNVGINCKCILFNKKKCAITHVVVLLGKANNHQLFIHNTYINQIHQRGVE